MKAVHDLRARARRLKTRNKQATSEKPESASPTRHDTDDHHHHAEGLQVWHSARQKVPGIVAVLFRSVLHRHTQIEEAHAGFLPDMPKDELRAGHLWTQ